MNSNDTFSLTRHIQNVVFSTCNRYKKVNSRCDFFFHTVSSKSSVFHPYSISQGGRATFQQPQVAAASHLPARHGPEPGAHLPQEHPGDTALSLEPTSPKSTPGKGAGVAGSGICQAHLTSGPLPPGPMRSRTAEPV